VTAAPAALPVTRREAILGHLAVHPDLTASELAKVIGSGSYLGPLLRDMRAKAQVVSRPGSRPGQGSPVLMWRVAPSGTVPPPREPVASEVLAHKRERDRRATAARRARAREPFAGALALPGAACAFEDPDLFFPDGDAEAEAKALAICASCPVRMPCYLRAVQNGERYGVWGGVNLEREPRRLRTASQRMSDEQQTIEPMTDQTVSPRPAASFLRAQQRDEASSPQQGPGGPYR
jgi:hypothetical protein